MITASYFVRLRGAQRCLFLSYYPSPVLFSLNLSWLDILYEFCYLTLQKSSGKRQ